MINQVGFPQLEGHLPELMAFVSGLADDYQAGALDSWEALAGRTHAFFTPARLAQVEAVVPGWREMAAYAGGMTLVHVMCAFVGLLQSPEYWRATPSQQALMHWIVLLHDLAKWVRPGERDSTHPYRSAALAGGLLPGLGFPVAVELACEFDREFARWAALVGAAVLVRQEGGKTNYIPDTRYLRPIVDGIDRLFGADTPAGLIVRTILLHASVTVLAQWPQAAPLTEAEEARYLDAALLPLLKMMMLADNDGWELFTDNREPFRAETLAVFDRLGAALQT
jgi:hypothetical protein